MNQILITGEEINKETKKEKKVVEINKIVIFFAVCITILGICIIFAGIYSKIKTNQTVEANTKPVVQIEKNDSNNTVDIKINHIRGIKEIKYKWNNEEETIINGNNQKDIFEQIELKGGKNTLTVTVVDENNQTVSYQKEYTVGNIPQIKLEAVSNGIKVMINCEDTIQNIKYSWDNENEQKIDINDTVYEGIISAPKGQHTLYIVATTTEGIEATKSQLVVGDTEPTLNIKADIINGKLSFVVDAEDDEQITKVEIILNEGETQVIDVNDKTYHKEIEMTDGILNKLMVTVYNVNGLKSTLGASFNNE